MGKIDSSYLVIDALILCIQNQVSIHLLSYILQVQGEFNVRMRDDALKQGYTMNEYSIKHTDTGETVDKVFQEECEIFKFLGMNI